MIMVMEVKRNIEPLERDGSASNYKTQQFTTIGNFQPLSTPPVIKCAKRGRPKKTIFFGTMVITHEGKMMK